MTEMAHLSRVQCKVSWELLLAFAWVLCMGMFGVLLMGSLNTRISMSTFSLALLIIRIQPTYIN